MKRTVLMAVATALMICSFASADIILTSGDIGPSNPVTMIHDRVGLLMTRPEAWVVSNINIPYPSELEGQDEIHVTLYFVPDAVSAGDVDFRVSYYVHNVGDAYNYGGVGPSINPAPVAVGGSDTQIYAQTFVFNNILPAGDIFNLNISRWFYGDATDTYPTGIYIHALKLEGQSLGAIGDGADTPTSLRAFEIAPNPFSSHATIRYALDRSSEVSIHVYDAQGRTVDVINRGVEAPGEYSLEWNLPGAGPGMYFVKLAVGGATYATKSLRIE